MPKDFVSSLGFRLRALALAWTALLLAAGCGGAPASGNLLAGRQPTKTWDVARAGVLTDGIAARPGDDWMTDLTAHFGSPHAAVEYDLGASYSFSAAFLEGDHNDEYVVGLSEDGANFAPLWIAPTRSESGQQPRSAADLQGHGRYVRLSPGRGDGHFSVSELQLFAERPAEFPPTVPTRRGVEIGEAVRGATLTFAAALVVFLLATASAFGRVGALVALVPLLFSAFRLLRIVDTAWPLAPLDISLIRAATAGVAALATWTSIFLAPRFRPARRPVLGVLGVCAALGVAAFYNMGRPQFFDRSTGEPSFIHAYDMRVYFPIAKYFEELGFDGTYLASVAAYADDDAGVTLASLGMTPLRDMDTLRMTRVQDVEWKIRAVQKRFSPERWREFKRDMRYFRETMGVQDYLGSITDHGGNATPVWFAVARLIFFHTDASHTTLFVAALLDPLLLLLMFLAIGKAYGVRTMLVSMVVFGANDFYMFGSNWAGATLRHDWLAYLGIGLAALKLERWAAGGAFLAFAAMIRAFPALALLGAALPIGWAVWEERGEGGVRALFTALRRRRDLVRIVAGAAICVLVAGLVSSFVFSFGAWGDWLRKVAALDHDPSTNETSLRAFIAGTGGDQQVILRNRWPLYTLALAIPSLSVLWSARRRRPDQTAVIALLLVPIIFNPANYYLHYVCLLPLLANELRARAQGEAWMTESDAPVWLAVLGVCAAQYWTVLEHDETLHFRYATVLYFAVMAFLLMHAIRQNAEPAATAKLEAAEP
ncbi:MAG TPA: hypothetical protein VK550_29485 [Polyangiaceae bacterium]|nr:hypothetical protein [Polyangiaceae bacterium]